VVTAEASYHVNYDDCTVEFLKQAGVETTHVKLGDVGIHGNGHMMFMDKNNLDIVDKVIRKWIRETIGK